MKQGSQEASTLRCSSTGVEELDHILHGGWPSGSVILLTGKPGTGKTILSFQWLFNGVSMGENGLYITLTEPLFRTVKNLENMQFYDREAIESEKLKIIDMRQKEARTPEQTIKFLSKQVIATKAKRLCIDSITAIAYQLDDKQKIRSFIFELGKTLATLGCTTVLTSEVSDKNKLSVYGVEEFISDGIIRMEQVKHEDTMHRVMQIVKLRGVGYRARDITYKIGDKGIIPFRHYTLPLSYKSSERRVSTGMPMLDKMMHGGIFKGSSTFIAGSTGTGKSVFSLQFMQAGLTNEERCLYVSFEESSNQIRRNAMRFGWNFDEKQDQLFLRCMYPDERLLDEHFADIKKIIDEKKISRCVIDSLSSISSAFSEKAFERFVHTLYAYLKLMNVTAVFTLETDSNSGMSGLTGTQVSTITDNVILLRHVEMQGQLRQFMNIVKVKGGSHSRGLRVYKITRHGVEIGQKMSGYEGLMTGIGRKVSDTIEEKLENEFCEFLGPIGSQVFNKILETGINEHSITTYIDSLSEEGIIKASNAEAFKVDVLNILEHKQQ
ncbi:MAG: AAA family ATPase [Candidatus Woesearchaeota archaeon]|nr:AAA family ATPase [Candidatus Woesearchaeota archaeon]